MAIIYSIRSKVKEREASIYLRVKIYGIDIKVKTPFKVYPKLWKKNWVAINKTLDSKTEKETVERLDTLLKNAKSLIELHINQYGTISRADISALIKGSQCTNKKELDMNGYLAKLIRDMKIGARLHKGKPFQFGTIQAWESFQKLWMEYQTTHKKEINFEDVNRTLYADFMKFMDKYEVRKAKDNLPAQIGYRANTKSKFIKTLKSLMSYSLEDGLHQNRAFQMSSFARNNVQTDSIYLNDSEILKLFDYKPMNIIDEQVRDIFLLGCYTGQRISDYSNISQSDIITLNNGKRAIKITQKKTGNNVVIPVLYSELDFLIDKYKDNGFPKVSDVEINKRIKIIGAACGIDQPIVITEVIGTKKIKTTKKKCELIVTHTARRSCITNLYKTNIFDIPELMSISGHKTTKSFFTYLKITAEEQAAKMQRKMESYQI